jgi:glycosyltransferase EpsE
MKPRISILMGIYNCASTLPEALDSLYNQTYNNFKLILCDDASTDNTYEVAKEYVIKYDNIILLKNEKNLKLAATLNRCLEHADTEYIARMDGDDISLPERFEQEITFLDNHPEYALVSCPMIYFDETGDWGVGSPKEKPTKEDFRYNSPFAHAPCMIRTNVLQDVGGYTVSSLLTRGQDYHLWHKIYKKGYVGYNLQVPLYKMRDDKNAVARRTFKTRCKSVIVKVKVMNALGIKYGFIYAIPNFIKIFIPDFLMIFFRKMKMKIK